MTIKRGCFSCENAARFDELPPRERIASDEHWRVAHAVGTGLPGWLVLLPRRHVLTIADLTDAEAAGLGYWQVRLSRALHAVTGCVKTYVVQFAEAEGFGHVHFHVIPRPADLPADRRGPNVFGFLGQPDGQAVNADEMDGVASALAQWLARAADTSQGHHGPSTGRDENDAVPESLVGALHEVNKIAKRNAAFEVGGPARELVGDPAQQLGDFRAALAVTLGMVVAERDPAGRPVLIVPTDGEILDEVRRLRELVNSADVE